jgi:dihydrofolate reductase
MGRIVVSEFVSLDGVMEAPGGEPGYHHTGWVFRYIDEAQIAIKYLEVLHCAALLIGRITYESFAGAWPQRTGDFADRMNTMPKYVASKSLQTPEWNNTAVLEGGTATAVTKLKQDIAGDIVVPGSRTLVDFLRRKSLIDEYRLMVFPVVLGSGARLFQDSPEDLGLRFVSSEPLPDGAVVLTYQVES